MAVSRALGYGKRGSQSGPRFFSQQLSDSVSKTARVESRITRSGVILWWTSTGATFPRKDCARSPSYVCPCASPKLGAPLESITYQRCVTCYMDDIQLWSFGEGQVFPSFSLIRLAVSLQDFLRTSFKALGGFYDDFQENMDGHPVFCDFANVPSRPVWYTKSPRAAQPTGSTLIQQHLSCRKWTTAFSSNLF